MLLFLVLFVRLRNWRTRASLEICRRFRSMPPRKGLGQCKAAAAVAVVAAAVAATGYGN